MKYRKFFNEKSHYSPDFSEKNFSGKEKNFNIKIPLKNIIIIQNILKILSFIFIPKLIKYLDGKASALGVH